MAVSIIPTFAPREFPYPAVSPWHAIRNLRAVEEYATLLRLRQESWDRGEREDDPEESDIVHPHEEDGYDEGAWEAYWIHGGDCPPY